MTRSSQSQSFLPIIVLLSCCLSVIQANVSSLRKFENRITLPIRECNVSFAWFSVQAMDQEVLSLSSHIGTCQRQLPEPGFNVVNFPGVEIYFSQFSSATSAAARYFYLRDTILGQNILMIWQPSSYTGGSESSVSLQLINPFRKDYIIRPQHILCYRKTCPPTALPPVATTSAAVASNILDERTSIVQDDMMFEGGDGMFGWTDLFLYKLLCKVIGALVFFMLGVICVLALLYRKALLKRKRVQQELELALSFTSQQSKATPVFGNISRRRDRVIYQNSDRSGCMETKMALLNPDTCSLQAYTPQSSFTTRSLSHGGRYLDT